MMPDEVYEVAQKIVCNVVGAHPNSVKPDTRFSELNMDEADFYEIYKRCCSELNVSLNSILNTMPVYRVGAGIQVMASLRKLAPFSDEAAQVLHQYDVHFEDETVRSLAETMHESRYISSGETQPPLHPPRSKLFVIGWLLGLLMLVVFIPLGLAMLPCNSLKSDCNAPVWRQMIAMFPTTFFIGVLVLIGAFGPGIWGMKQYKKKLKQRAEKWGDGTQNLKL